MTYRSKQLAAKFAISANTLRNYEAKGLLPEATRSSNGYRVYTELHAAYLACIRAMLPTFGMEITTDVMHCLQQNKLHDALWLVKERGVILYREKKKLEALMLDMDRYVDDDRRFSINEVSLQTGIDKTKIRYWEKAGLLTIKRNKTNGYRFYHTVHLFQIRLIYFMRNFIYSEDTVKLKQMIAKVDANHMMELKKIATTMLTHFHKTNESQMCGIAYLYQLIQFIRRENIATLKPPIV